MLSYSVDSKGVQRMLQKMATEMPSEIQSCMTKSLEGGVKSAKSYVPKDTLKLMRSIQVDGKVRRRGNIIAGSYSARANNSKGKNYGVYQEAGWTDKSGSFHEGRFYMLKSKAKAEKVFVRECNKALGRYVRT